MLIHVEIEADTSLRLLFYFFTTSSCNTDRYLFGFPVRFRHLLLCLCVGFTNKVCCIMSLPVCLSAVKEKLKLILRFEREVALLLIAHLIHLDVIVFQVMDTWVPSLCRTKWNFTLKVNVIMLFLSILLTNPVYIIPFSSSCWSIHICKDQDCWQATQPHIGRALRVIILLK